MLSWEKSRFLLFSRLIICHYALIKYLLEQQCMSFVHQDFFIFRPLGDLVTLKGFCAGLFGGNLKSDDSPTFLIWKIR